MKQFFTSYMLLWTILLLPLVSFALISIFLLKHKTLAIYTSVGSAVVNAVLAIYMVTAIKVDPSTIPFFQWLQVADFQVKISLTWDPLSRLMILIVTCIGAAIHIYSMDYMKEDESRSRFFAYLSLFMFSMLGIVFAGNFVMMFIFWELVGLSSYLLIGFWYQKPSAADAGKKAFIVNKIGDFGFIIGIILVWVSWKTVDFSSLQAMSDFGIRPGVFNVSAVSPELLSIIALLLFCGAVGKSAQFPLHVWLPDAMEGPTPVSALIHAATMVAAGIYMLCRIFFILALADNALMIISWIGGITALLAALWAVGQDDIKRILAYSTLSQLGYMTMAVGLSAPGPAMFHLTTHAFFKALLFLGAGSVILAMHHEQNIWKMGGLWSRMRVTSITFLIGLLALCGLPLSLFGIPFFSGFLSKEAILEVAFQKNTPLFIIGLCTAFLTAFYMGRLYFVAFLGGHREHHATHAHENGFRVTLPLCFLALLSFGYWFGHTSHTSITVNNMGGFPTHGGIDRSIQLLMMVIPFLGLGVSWAVYSKAPVDPIEKSMPILRKALASKFYFDEIYDWAVQKIQGGIAYIMELIEIIVVDGIGVKGVTFVTYCTGNFLRCFQTGNLQTYAIFFGIALAAIIYWMFIS